MILDQTIVATNLESNSDKGNWTKGNWADPRFFTLKGTFSSEGFRANVKRVQLKEDGPLNFLGKLGFFNHTWNNTVIARLVLLFLILQGDDRPLKWSSRAPFNLPHDAKKEKN